MIGSWFPQIWSIFKRENQSEVQIVKQVKNRHLKLDGRMTRWIRYWFEKQYRPRGWFYFLKKL